MFNDENDVKKKAPYQLGQDISDLSIADLQNIIEELATETARLEADIKAKKASINAASSLFK